MLQFCATTKRQNKTITTKIQAISFNRLIKLFLQQNQYGKKNVLFKIPRIFLRIRYEKNMR